MATFTDLFNEYENTKDICSFCSEHTEATRFLLIRSLDRQSISEIIKDKTDEEDASGKLFDLMKRVYETNITIDELLRFIENKRATIVRERENEIEGLPEMLGSFPIVNCGVRNDKIDDVVKSLVRNKDIKTFDELQREMDEKIIPRIQQYIMWSYYNQTSNDVLELYFLRHPKIIPTLRKIHNIDFFIKLNDNIIPFDLKVTHVSDTYFDLLAKGFEVSNESDNYTLGDGEEEIKTIKQFYSSKKREYGLPNYGGLAKEELLDYLIQTEKEDAMLFVERIKTNRALLVRTTEADLKQLEWWNYKYQGERLFSNNNRFFLFMSYRDRFTDGRALKGKTVELGEKIRNLLDNLSEEDIHTIKYHYDKDTRLIGDYTAKSLSTIYVE